MKPQTEPLPHVLFIEARDDGHHLMFVSTIAGALLANGHALTLAIPKTDRIRDRLTTLGCNWLDQVDWVHWNAGDGLRMLPEAVRHMANSHAGEVFWNCLDEMMSPLLRKAAFGWRPPQPLHGKISGVYIRPRPMDPHCTGDGLNGWLKRRGWAALRRDGWFRRIFVLDERLADHPDVRAATVDIRFLPEPNEGRPEPVVDRASARAQLRIPQDVTVFLQFGLGTRRKGLHLTLDAWHGMPADTRAFLLCAGEVDAEFAQSLRDLEAAGRARVLNRYVSDAEEQLCFAAADVVLMPYVNHYGSSNVLSRAAASGRMVLCSDWGLLGHRVRHHGLGELCRHRDAASLRESVIRLAGADRAALTRHEAALCNFAESGSSEAVRKALQGCFPA